MTLDLPLNHNPLMRRFFEIIKEGDRTWAWIVQRSGVSYNTMWRWRERNPSGVENLQAALNAMGHELVIRKCDGVDG